jgi:hypothetical protein
MAMTHTAYMPAPNPLAVALRHWPVFALALASAFGAMYCSAEFALGASLAEAVPRRGTTGGSWPCSISPAWAPASRSSAGAVSRPGAGAAAPDSPRDRTP